MNLGTVNFEPCLGCPKRSLCGSPHNTPDMPERVLKPLLSKASNQDLEDAVREQNQFVMMLGIFGQQQERIKWVEFYAGVFQWELTRRANAGNSDAKEILALHSITPERYDNRTWEELVASAPNPATKPAFQGLLQALFGPNVSPSGEE